MTDADDGGDGAISAISVGGSDGIMSGGAGGAIDETDGPAAEDGIDGEGDDALDFTGAGLGERLSHPDCRGWSTFCSQRRGRLVEDEGRGECDIALEGIEVVVMVVDVAGS